MSHSQRFPAQIEDDKLYKATIIRGGEIQLTHEQANTISQAMLSEERGLVIHIAEIDMTLRVGEIRRVERDFEAELARNIERRNQEQRQLELLEAKQKTAGKRCHGQYSIQREIFQVIQERNPKTWPHLVQYSKYPEARALQQQVYDELWADQTEWCDYKKGLCACDNAAASMLGVRT